MVGAATLIYGCINKVLRLISALVNRAIRNRSRQMVQGTGASTVEDVSQYGCTPAMQVDCVDCAMLCTNVVTANFVL